MVGIALVTGVTVVLTSAEAGIGKQAAEHVRADLVISGTTSTGRPEAFDPAVLIAVLGTVDTLVLSVLERTRELLRAVGLDHGQVVRRGTAQAGVSGCGRPR